MLRHPIALPLALAATAAAAACSVHSDAVPGRIDRDHAALVAFVDDQDSGNVAQALRVSSPECAR